jgi:hypothetical protein
MEYFFSVHYKQTNIRYFLGVTVIRPFYKMLVFTIAFRRIARLMEAPRTRSGQPEIYVPGLALSFSVVYFFSG